MALSRAFKGVWIPREIWFSDDLSLVEKVLFTEISYLDNERGCFASNQYFAEFLGISARQVSHYISSLKEKNYITLQMENQHLRTIRVKGKWAQVPSTEAQRRLEEIREQLQDHMSLNNNSSRR